MLLKRTLTDRKVHRLLVPALLSLGLAACSSGGNSDSIPEGEVLDDEFVWVDYPLSPGEVVPLLDDPDAAPAQGPTLADPHYNLLEAESLTPMGNYPSAPANLRIDLLSQDWVDLNWSPSLDLDGEVVAYKVHRSDGHVYTVEKGKTSNAPVTQRELDKFWDTSSFMDCNHTHFSFSSDENSPLHFDSIYSCEINGPTPGEQYTYFVTAVDDDGNESPPSNQITLRFPTFSGAPIPRFTDPHLNPRDDFAQRNNLSNVDYFLNEFDLVWSDEFNGADIDTSKWNTRLPWNDLQTINNEEQYYVDPTGPYQVDYEPFKFNGSTMTIESTPTLESQAQDLPPMCEELNPRGTERCQYLSGTITSMDKFHFLYGYVEGRMKVSGAYGALSSFFMVSRWPGEGVHLHEPEIDIIEYLGFNQYGDENAFASYHFLDGTYGITRSEPSNETQRPVDAYFSDDFHTYGVLWEPQLVIWYIDGVEVRRIVGPQVARLPMYIISHLISGSGWAPSPDPAADYWPMQYETDYIRVYQRAPFHGWGTIEGTID